MNKKLIIDARMINHSGIGTYLQNLLPEVIKLFNTTLIGDEEKLKEHSFTDNCEIINVRSKVYSFDEQVRIPLIVPKSDLFWVPHINLPLLPVKSSRSLMTVHDVYHLAFKDELSFNQKLYANWVIKSAIKKVDKIITVSDFSKSQIIKYTGKNSEKITVIHNGVDTAKYKVISDKAELIKAKDKFKLPEKYILFVGNIKPNKNLKQLLNSFKNIYSQLPGYELVIVGKKEGFVIGDDSIFSFLDSHSSLKKKIHLLGEVNRNDLVNLYNLADLFVFPSLYEGFGLPPLEAMACGCPVIVSDVCSLPEVCGDAVLYFNPEDQNELDRKILDVLHNDNLKNELKMKGLNHVKKFSWRESADKTVNVIKTMIG